MNLNSFDFGLTPQNISGQDAQNVWKNLDNLAKNNPEAYKNMIQMASKELGAQPPQFTQYKGNVPWVTIEVPIHPSYQKNGHSALRIQMHPDSTQTEDFDTLKSKKYKPVNQQAVDRHVLVYDVFVAPKWIRMFYEQKQLDTTTVKIIHFICDKLEPIIQARLISVKPTISLNHPYGSLTDPTKVETFSRQPQIDVKTKVDQSKEATMLQKEMAQISISKDQKGSNASNSKESQSAKGSHSKQQDIAMETRDDAIQIALGGGNKAKKNLIQVIDNDSCMQDSLKEVEVTMKDDNDTIMQCDNRQQTQVEGLTEVKTLKKVQQQPNNKENATNFGNIQAVNSGHQSTKCVIEEVESEEEEFVSTAKIEYVYAKSQKNTSSALKF